MATELDIASRIAAPIVTFFLGKAWPRIVIEVRSRRAKRFWSPVAKRDARVVLGRHERPEWERSGLLGIGDVRALEQLQNHFRRLRLPTFRFEYADEIRGQRLRGNLITLGGPFANSLTKELMNQLGCSWGFRHESPESFAVTDARTGREYVPARRDDGVVESDFGLIVRARNPFDESDGLVLCFAGCYGQGTLASVQAATTERAFLSHPHIAEGSAVECLVRADVVADVPQRIHVLDVRALG